jgi:hypothetical protein
MDALVSHFTGILQDRLEYIVCDDNNSKYDFLSELSAHYEKIFINILMKSFNCDTRQELREMLFKYIDHVLKLKKKIILEYNTQLTLTYDMKPITKPAQNKYLANQYISKYTEYCVGYEIYDFIEHEMTGCIFMNGLKCIYTFDPKDIIFLLTNYQLSPKIHVMLENSSFCKAIDIMMVKQTIFENISKSLSRILDDEYDINIKYNKIDKTSDLKQARWYNSVWFTSGKRSCVNEYSCKIFINPKIVKTDSNLNPNHI